MPALLILSGCVREPAVGVDVAASIDGEEIRYSEFESYLRSQVDPQALPPDGQVRSRLFDQFVDEQLLIRLAIERGLGVRDPDRRVDQRQALAFLLGGSSERAWSETELEAYYTAHLQGFQRPEQVHLRQILVPERDQAAEAQQALARGEDFAQVAARFSQGPKAHLGGDQGRLSREDLPPAFIDTIFELQAGEVSGVVEAEYGFHIFQVVERYPAEMLSLEQGAGQIRQVLERRRVDELVARFFNEAQERYNVEVFPNNFPFEYRGRYANQDTP